ncbi:MAG: hypothetical protein ABIH50_05960 [bacterium]
MRVSRTKLQAQTALTPKRPTEVLSVWQNKNNQAAQGLIQKLGGSAQETLAGLFSADEKSFRGRLGAAFEVGVIRAGVVSPVGHFQLPAVDAGERPIMTRLESCILDQAPNIVINQLSEEVIKSILKLVIYADIPRSRIIGRVLDGGQKFSK